MTPPPVRHAAEDRTPWLQGCNNPVENGRMDFDANDLLLFARVAEVGSFSRAAERMQIEKSTVSRRIAALEKRFGERLFFHRNTRKLALTDFGLSLLDHARALAVEVDGAQALAQHRQARPSGRLRVSLPGDFASIALSRMAAAFVRDYPAILLEMDLSPRRVDLIGENFDLAVRFGDLPHDSLLAARKLADITAGLYAAPAYLQQMGEPTSPEDLPKLHGLLLVPHAGEVRSWNLRRGPADAQEQWKGMPEHYTLANQPAMLMHMAQAGFGVVSLPDVSVGESVQRGLLKRILPEWSAPANPCWAVFPGRRLMPARTRAFLDALVATMAASIEASQAKP